MPVGAMRGTRVDVAVETDRELLWAVLNERADDLPTEALCAVVAAADELLEPRTLPNLLAVDPGMGNVAEVLRAVRIRMQTAAGSLTSVPEAFGCARAARHLVEAERILAGRR